MNTRPLPHDLDAERALIGALMINPNAINDIRPILKSGDIYRDENRILFDTLLDMHERGLPLDPITVQDELEKQPHPKHGNALIAIGGFAEITRHFQYVPTALHATRYAQIVAEHGARRRLLWTSEQITEATYKEEPLDLIRQKADRWLGQSTPMVARTVDHIGAALEGMLEKQAQIESGESQFFLPCALQSMERAFGGYARGECTVLSAPTGEGKTALALQEFLDKARRDYSAVYVSTEVYAHVLTERLVSHQGQINYDQIRRGFNPHNTDLPAARGTIEDYKRDRDDAIEKLFKRPLHVMAPVMDFTSRRVTRPDLTPGGIRAALRSYAEKQPLDFVVVDYLTNLELDLGRSSSDRSLIVEAALRTLREMAIELGAALLVVAQLTREAAREREPRLHHLEQSTGIEKGSDNVWLMYAPDSDNNHIRTILGAKGRNVGKSKVNDIHFNGATQTFTDEHSRLLDNPGSGW
jgi:replicative DNA helicase